MNSESEESSGNKAEASPIFSKHAQRLSRSNAVHRTIEQKHQNSSIDEENTLGEDANSTAQNSPTKNLNSEIGPTKSNSSAVIQRNATSDKSATISEELNGASLRENGSFLANGSDAIQSDSDTKSRKTRKELQEVYRSQASKHKENHPLDSKVYSYPIGAKSPPKKGGK